MDIKYRDLQTEQLLWITIHGIIHISQQLEEY